MLLANPSRLALVSMIAALAACAANATTEGDSEVFETADSSGAPIIGGTTASSYPEAALVDMSRGGQMAAACSGAVIAPQVVLTAGHCVHGFDGWTITAPFAQNQRVRASGAAVYDWNNQSDTVDPNSHDLGLVFLATPIRLGSYPTIATAPVAAGGQIVNVGRINNGQFSSSALFVSKAIAVRDGRSYGYPYDYVASEVIQSGDSGGPDFLPGTHSIVAVNSGAGGGTEVLARVDLLATWIQQQISAHGGAGSNGGGTGTGTGGNGGTGTGGGTTPPPPAGPSEQEPNDSYQTPNALSGTLSGQLTAGDQDWFTWTVGATPVAYDLQLQGSGDAQLQMWKLVSGQYYRVANTSATRVAHTSNGAGSYVIVTFSPSSQPQSYALKLAK